MLGSNLCAVVIVKPGNEVRVFMYYLYFHATGIKTSPTVLHTRRRCTGRCTRGEEEILDNFPQTQILETFLTPVSFRDVAPWPRCQGGGADLKPQGRGRGADLVPLEKGRGAGLGLQGKVEKVNQSPAIGEAVGHQFLLRKGANQEGGQIRRSRKSTKRKRKRNQYSEALKS